MLMWSLKYSTGIPFKIIIIIAIILVTNIITWCHNHHLVSLWIYMISKFIYFLRTYSFETLNKRGGEVFWKRNLKCEMERGGMRYRLTDASPPEFQSSSTGSLLPENRDIQSSVGDQTSRFIFKEKERRAQNDFLYRKYSNVPRLPICFSSTHHETSEGTHFIITYVTFRFMCFELWNKTTHDSYD